MTGVKPCIVKFPFRKGILQLSPLPLFQGHKQHSEMDCDQAAMGLTPVMSDILPFS
jgi:hypothetical protein